jgi:hypothetical protein
MRAANEVCAASAFSIAMRWYSAAEQVPSDIITVRWNIVSQDAAVSRAIMIGRAKGELRSSLFMSYKVMIARRAARGAWIIPGGSVTLSLAEEATRMNVALGAKKSSWSGPCVMCQLHPPVFPAIVCANAMM